MRPRNNNLTENELEIMRILWQESPLKVAEVLAKIHKKPKPAYTSLMTTMKTMVEKKYLQAQKVGKAHHYSPLIKKENTLVSELKRVSKYFFNGSSSELILNLVKNEELNEDELQELRTIIEDKSC